MRKLVINGMTADLTGVGVIALTKQVNDINDVQNRRCNLSNTIELPLSPANQLIFLDASDVNSFNEQQRQFYSVNYIQDYEEIISAGSGKLLGVQNGKYQFIIYWGNISLVDILGDKTLRDLDISDLNHDWVLDNVKALVVPDTNQKVVYPIVSTLALEPLPDALSPSPPINGKAIKAYRLMPFVAVSRMLSQIEADSGITFSGADIRKYIDIASPEGSVAGVSNDLFVPVVSKKQATTLNIEVDSTQDVILDVNTFTYNDLDDDDYYGATPCKKTDWIEDLVPEFNEFGGEIEITQDGYYNISFLLRFLREIYSLTETNRYINQVEEMYIVADYYTSGAWLDPQIEDIISTPEDYDIGFNAFHGGVQDIVINDIPFSRTGYYSFKVNEAELQARKQLSAGDKVRFKIFYRYRGITRLATLSPIWKIVTYLAKQSIVQLEPPLIEFGDTWDVAENLPAIKQIDLIKFILAREGMLVQYTDDGSVAQCKKLSDIINDVQNAQDLSGNIQSWTVAEIHSELGQNNVMRYANHESVGDIAEGEFSINDNTLPLNNEFYVAPFSASENEIWVQRGDDVMLYPVINSDSEEKDFNSLGARICRLRLKYFAETGFCYFTDNVDTEAVGVKFVARFTSDLDMNNVLLTNYAQYTEIMNDFKRIEAVATLTTEEFKNLDLLKPAYIQQMGGYFLIEKVQDFVSGRLVKMTLIKI